MKNLFSNIIALDWLVLFSFQDVRNFRFTGNSQRYFSIDPTTGKLYVTKEIDREALPTTSGDIFNLQIEAKQKDNPLKSTIANVSLKYQYVEVFVINVFLGKLKYLNLNMILPLVLGYYQDQRFEW